MMTLRNSLTWRPKVSGSYLIISLRIYVPIKAQRCSLHDNTCFLGAGVEC
jgi:hypothetical protein